MYAEVWSDPRVMNLINDNYILIVLYTDDRTPLPENEWVTSSVDGKVKKTMGSAMSILKSPNFSQMHSRYMPH
jgi:hypothetical protein